ncbi:hypothetical protein QJS04_geneDACA023044 [Acorus gramineus]|uniref:Uncharacterized protein n=1 Tax=Acorus gramineus TaxID=55184 RepID=A0AAV9A9D3_ACOGR|nr:hypothetical protein QJS04_geneDACA023044 [Acorus gramineus]
MEKIQHLHLDINGLKLHLAQLGNTEVQVYEDVAQGICEAYIPAEFQVEDNVIADGAGFNTELTIEHDDMAAHGTFEVEAEDDGDDSLFCEDFSDKEQYQDMPQDNSEEDEVIEEGIGEEDIPGETNTSDQSHSHVSGGQLRTDVHLSGMTLHSTVRDFHSITNIGSFNSHSTMGTNSTSVGGSPYFTGMSAKSTMEGISISVGGVNASGPSTQSSIHETRYYLLKFDSDILHTVGGGDTVGDGVRCRAWVMTLPRMV